MAETGDDGRLRAVQVTGPGGAPPQVQFAHHPGGRRFRCQFGASSWLPLSLKQALSLALMW